MSIINKIKNLFYDEVIIEEKIEKPTLVNEQKKVEVKKPENDNINNEIISERQFVKTEQNFKFPVIFEDEDIKEEPKKIEIKKEEKEKPAYVKPKLDREVIKEVIERPKKFTVSPVISPVYGVLDKNYQKEEVLNKNDDIYKTKELVINFDTIRQKAYGSLEDELTDLIESNLSDDENNTVKEVEIEKTTIINDDLLENLKDEKKEEYDFKDFGVEYKVDDSFKESDKNEEKPKHVAKDKRKTEIREADSREDTIVKSDDEEKKELELTDDLFSLIDSMYDN